MITVGGSQACYLVTFPLLVLLETESEAFEVPENEG